MKTIQYIGSAVLFIKCVGTLVIINANRYLGTSKQPLQLLKLKILL